MSLNALSLVKAWIASKVENDGRDDPVCDPERVWLGRDILQQEAESTMRFHNFVHNKCLSGKYPLILPQDPTRDSAIKDAYVYLSMLHMFNLQWKGDVWESIQASRVTRKSKSKTGDTYDDDFEEWVVKLLKKDALIYETPREPTPVPSSARDYENRRSRDTTPVARPRSTMYDDDELPDWHREALHLMSAADLVAAFPQPDQYPKDLDEYDFDHF